MRSSGTRVQSPAGARVGRASLSRTARAWTPLAHRPPLPIAPLAELREALSDILPLPAVLSDADERAKRMGKPLPSALAAAAADARGVPPARPRAGAAARGESGESPPLAPALAAQVAGRGRTSPHAAFEQWARRKKDRQYKYSKAYSKGYKGRRSRA